MVTHQTVNTFKISVEVLNVFMMSALYYITKTDDCKHN
ncbi:hypothetical protein [Campylobacter phage CJLB-14]|nr:hypothetical protein [Campylobacter phage CJLB-14]